MTTYTVYYRVEGSIHAFAPIRRLPKAVADMAAEDLRSRPGYVEVRVVEDEK